MLVIGMVMARISMEMVHRTAQMRASTFFDCISDSARVH